jgi:DNA-directed RNA polymerase subunit RPC12/RpoP
VITFSCPNCDKLLNHPKAQAKVVCPRCGQKIIVPSPLPAASNPTVLGKLPDSPPASDMEQPAMAFPTDERPPMFQFACPRCNATLHAHAADAGRTLECPRCNVLVDVPGSEPASELSLVRPRSEHCIDSPPETPVGAVPVSTFLGIASLVIEGVAVLFLVLPCFWFLALPISGLGFMLGGVSLIVSLVKKDRGLVYGILGTVIGAILTAFIGLFVLYTQVRLHQALDRLGQ